MGYVKVENLIKKYHNKLILDIKNLVILKNEVVSVIGPSGCGKTTLLRCLAGLEKADSGDITYNGCALMKGGKHIKDRTIDYNFGFIFQDFNLFDNLSVADNIRLAPRLVERLKKSELDNLSYELLKQVGLVDKLNSFPSNLSGGQKQRIAICRALAMKPEILLIDEPTSSLDIEAIDELVKCLKNLVEQKITLIIVTHDIEFAKRISTRLIFINDCKINYDLNINDIDKINDSKFLKFINK